MYRYILANSKTKMPILYTDEIEYILKKYTIVAKANGHPYSRNNDKKYDGVSDEMIINFLNGGGYYAHEEFLIIDTHRNNDFKHVSYRGDEEVMTLIELLELIKINIRKLNIDKIID